MERAYEALQQYVDVQGHSRVPADYQEGELALGTWVKWQRRMYQRGLIAQERAARLESLPGWVWADGGTCPQRSFVR